MPKLIIQAQSQEWSQDLVPGSNVVGRASQCTIPIKDPSLSRQHCEIVLSEGAARLLDKGSMNGTLLNGKRVHEQALQPGDRITIGSVHLWFELKGNLPTEKKDLPRAQPAPEPIPNAPTRRAITVQPEEAAAAPRPGARVEAAAYLADYAFRGKAGGPWGLIALGVAAAAAAVVLVLVGRTLLSGAPSVKREDDNLVKNGSFDLSARPDGWQARAANGARGADKAAGTLGLEPAQGRGGGPCMAIDKAAADSGLEVLWTADLAAPGAAVEASAQVRFEGFAGHAAFKIEWLRPRGVVAFETCSKPVTRCADWTPVGGRFVPPAGATGFRAGLLFLGRGGRILVDDVRVLPGSAESAPPLALADHRIHVGDPGVFQFDVRGRRPVTDIGLRLESEKEGAVWQGLGDRVKVEQKPDQPRRLTWHGRLFNPGDLREIEYDATLEAADHHTDVFYRFAADQLRQVDRVTLAFTPPRSTLLGIDGNKPVSRIVASSPEGELSFEFLAPARVRVVQVQGLSRILASFRVDPAADPAEFGFQIGDAGAGKDPEERARRFEGAGRHGEALEAYKDVDKNLKDAQRREEVAKKIARFQKSERDAWAEIQALHFKAWLSRRPEYEKEARKLLVAYEQKWTGGTSPGDFGAKAAELREEDRRQAAAGADPDAERPKQLLALGKKYADAGLKNLAQSALRTLLDRYPQSDAAAEARELIKTLGM